MTKPLSFYSQALLYILGCSFASAHSYHTATEVIADHSNHKQSIPFAKIASGHIVGDRVFVVNTPGPKELPPTALSALGPNWADDSADGFRLVAGGVGTETQGHSPWESDGSPQRGQQRFAGTGITTSWTFNSVDGHCHLPDGAVINAIYATWTTRGKSGAKYSYTEGSKSAWVEKVHETDPHSDLQVKWTDSKHIVRTANFEKVFKGPILVKGRDGFTLKGEKILGKNTHQTDTILLDVTLGGHHPHKSSKKMRAKPTLSVATEVPVYPDDMEPLEPEAAHAKLGDSFTIPELGLQIVWVKPGTFTMGSPSSESGRESDETQHPVTLINGFYLGKYEVTQDQWEKVMGSNPSKYRGADRPVEMVSWNDAVAFCKKLTEMEKKAGRVPEGMAYQLPTEAQWEYTCRAGTTTAYSWGDSISAKNASHHRKNPEGTTPVGKYPPNPWAFHDMHGNVWEWCADWYNTYPIGSVTNPEGPASGWDRVLRGGSWYHTGPGLRSAKRRFHRPLQPSRLVGFRVALQEMIHQEHEKPADEALVTTETPVAPGDMPPLDERNPKKKKIHQVGPPDANFELIWIEPGTFMMGSPQDESGRKSNENQHQVTLTQGYYLGKYEVTVAQYKWVMGALPEDNLSKGDNFPVGGADWNDAMAFCKKLTEMERKAGRLPKGMRFQLPTEAEWEYACKAGTTTIYSWGNHPDQSKANYGHGFKVGKDFVNQVKTVGKYEANPWGFHDMHGNVYEWCNDTATFAVPTRPGHHEMPYPKGPVKDPQGHQGNSVHYQFFDGKAHKLSPFTTYSGVVNSKIQRGGSWVSGAGAIRSAYRHSHPQSDTIHYKGFRVALKRIKQAKVLSN